MPQPVVPEPHTECGEFRLDPTNVGTLVRNHGVIASYLDDWADRVRREVSHDRCLGRMDQEYLLGYQRALRDVAFHLREGDALPGGPVYRYDQAS